MYSFLVEPQLTKEVREDLMDSIKAKGVLNPIIVSRDGKIIDGSKRYKIAMELGLKEEDMPKRVLDVDCRQKPNLCLALRIVLNEVRWQSTKLEERRQVILAYAKEYIDNLPMEERDGLLSSLAREEVPRQLSMYIVKETGIPHSTVHADLKTLIILPEVKKLLGIEEKPQPAEKPVEVIVKVPTSAAEALAQLPPEARSEVAEKLARRQISVEDVKKMVQRVAQQPQQQQQGQPQQEEVRVEVKVEEAVKEATTEKKREKLSERFEKESEELYEKVRRGEVSKDDVIIILKPSSSPERFPYLVQTLVRWAYMLSVSDEVITKLIDAIYSLPIPKEITDIPKVLFTLACELSRSLAESHSSEFKVLSRAIDNVCVKRTCEDVDYLIS